MYKQKKMLDDLVDYVYKDDTRLKAYHAFYIEVSDKALKSKHGHYEVQKRRIVLFNSYRDETKLVITSIHELAHHITHMQGDFKVHGREFYGNFEKLLHGALDMKLFTKKEWFDMISEVGRDAIDENKIRHMLETYKPVPSGYKADKKRITVYDSYSIKEELKQQGYTYNKLDKGWEIETDASDIETLTAYLDSCNVKYSVTDAAKVIVRNEDDKPSFLVSVENAYSIRDYLREQYADSGLYFRKTDKCWCIKTDSEKAAADAAHKVVEICKEHPRAAVTVKNVKRISHKEIKIQLTQAALKDKYSEG